MYVSVPLLLLLSLLLAGGSGALGWWWAQRKTPLPVPVAGIALRDTVTGLYNREAMLEALARHLSLADRSKQPVTVLMVEIDGWSRLTESHNAARQAALLQAVALRMAARVRNHDLLGHWGDARFLVVLPDSDVGGGLVLAQDLSEGFSLQTLVIEDMPVAVTVSIGVHGRHSSPQNRLQHLAPDMVVGAARALEVSVADGPNRIAINP